MQRSINYCSISRRSNFILCVHLFQPAIYLELKHFAELVSLLAKGWKQQCTEIKRSTVVKREAASTSITDSEHHPAIRLSDTWLTHPDDIQLTGDTGLGKVLKRSQRILKKIICPVFQLSTLPQTFTIWWGVRGLIFLIFCQRCGSRPSKWIGLNGMVRLAGLKTQRLNRCFTVHHLCLVL